MVKVSIFICGLMGAGLAMTTTSVNLLWIVSADVLYSILTPQLICTFFLPQWVNHYGAVSGFVLALLLRVLIGEPQLGLPDVLPLPWDRIQEDGHRFRLFPFCTVLMLMTTGTIIIVSCLTVWLSQKKLLRINDAEMDTNNADCMVPLRTDVGETTEREQNEEQFPLSSQRGDEEEEKC